MQSVAVAVVLAAYVAGAGASSVCPLPGIQNGVPSQGFPITYIPPYSPVVAAPPECSKLRISDNCAPIFGRRMLRGPAPVSRRRLQGAQTSLQATCDSSDVVLDCTAVMPYGVITSISPAFYGRNDTQCSVGTLPATCGSYPDLASAILRQCAGQPFCRGLVFPSDPCFGYCKYTTAQAYCDYPPANQHQIVERCEGSSPTTLTCSTGQTIGSIVSGFYGRSNTYACASNVASEKANPACSLTTFVDDVRTQCVGKTSCTPTYASDPCPFILKWTSASWTCV